MKKRKTVAICASGLVLALALSGVVAVAAQSKKGNEADTSGLTGTMQMDGQSYVYSDGGWLTQVDYQAKHPNDKASVMWGVDEFATWMEQQRAENQKLADSGDVSFYYKTSGENSDGALRAWTQADVDTQYAQWQEQLKQMQQGYQYTKPITLDNGAVLAGCMSPDVGESVSTPGSTVITLPDGSTVDLGTFDTAKEATEAVKQYLQQQVADGKLTQLQADTTLKNGAVE
ncbi:MAG: hypothetical protein RR949_00255 [Oscillospiraceae bacterium]